MKRVRLVVGLLALVRAFLPGLGGRLERLPGGVHEGAGSGQLALRVQVAVDGKEPGQGLKGSSD